MVAENALIKDTTNAVAWKGGMWAGVAGCSAREQRRAMGARSCDAGSMQSVKGGTKEGEQVTGCSDVHTLTHTYTRDAKCWTPGARRRQLRTEILCKILNFGLVSGHLMMPAVVVGGCESATLRPTRQSRVSAAVGSRGQRPGKPFNCPFHNSSLDFSLLAPRM